MTSHNLFRQDLLNCQFIYYSHKKNYLDNGPRRKNLVQSSKDDESFLIT